MTLALTIQPGRLLGGGFSGKNLFLWFSSTYAIGTSGAYGVFQPLAGESPAPGTWRLHGRGGPLGCGFGLEEAAGGRLVVSCPLPVPVQDLGDMFTFAELLAGQLGARELAGPKGEKLPLAGLKALYVETARANNQLLQELAAKGPFTVQGLRMPLRIPQRVCQRITSVPAQNGEKYFAAYLAEKQVHNFYYLAPAFYRDEAGTPLARYTLRDEVQSVIPKTPFVPCGPAPFSGQTVARWQVGYAAVPGTPPTQVDYETFFGRLEERALAPFDDEHLFLRPLTKSRILELLAPQE